MEFDTNVQSEALAKYNLKAIKNFSPFNEYLIGEKAALFQRDTGTQIFIWNLEKWGSDYSSEWQAGISGRSSFYHGDILIRSRRVRSLPGQTSKKAYKRVGGMMIHSADMGRGVIGVIDVTELMDDGNGGAWVHNNKQGFQDCEAYALLEAWLGDKADEYWDTHFDAIELKKGRTMYNPDHEWVQCEKCRKWRMLKPTFDSAKLVGDRSY